jgi:hypothetical protein
MVHHESQRPGVVKSSLLAVCTQFQIPGVEQISDFQVVMVRNIWIFSFPEVLETSGKQKLAR